MKTGSNFLLRIFASAWIVLAVVYELPNIYFLGYKVGMIPGGTSARLGVDLRADGRWYPHFIGGSNDSVLFGFVDVLLPWGSGKFMIASRTNLSPQRIQQQIDTKGQSPLGEVWLLRTAPTPSHTVFFFPSSRLQVVTNAPEGIRALSASS